VAQIGFAGLPPLVDQNMDAAAIDEAAALSAAASAFGSGVAERTQQRQDSQQDAEQAFDPNHGTLLSWWSAQSAGCSVPYPWPSPAPREPFDAPRKANRGDTKSYGLRNALWDDIGRNWTRNSNVPALPSPGRADSLSVLTMPNARYIYQAQEKIAVIYTVLFRAQILTKPDMKALATKAGIPYSTLKSAVQSHRFSSVVEDALAKIAQFDREQPYWVDEAIPEATRRSAPPDRYAGRDTVEQFRHRLNAEWHGNSVSFRASQRGYAALDPHMTRHELSDLGQATSDGVAIPFFLTAHFEPFFHPSGIMFGFRKASVTVEIDCTNGAHVGDRLGYPVPAQIRDALLSGDGLSRQLCWVIERHGLEPAVLQGEYSTVDEPLLAVRDYQSGTAIISCIEVNLFDRASYATDAGPELCGNKQALIEQIFSSELAEARSRHGWIMLSRQEMVIARYER